MSVNVVYFIQTHRDPEQVYRLVRTLRRGSEHGLIVVQHNSANCHLDWTPLKDLPGVHLLPAPGPQVRSNYSCQVAPYIALIDWLEREQIPYDWVVSTTGQDYPVTPLPKMEAFLEEATCDGFIRYWDVFSPESPWSKRKPRARYWHHYWRLPDRAEPVLRALRFVTRFLPLHFYLDYGSLVGVRVLRTPFNKDFRCYGGWAWFSLRRSVVLYLRDFLASHPDVVKHYQFTVTPEESIVQTVLVNSGRFNLVNDDLRYIDYSKAHKGSPRNLTAADIPLLATGQYHFARKFDFGADREVLDRIDRELLGMEPTPPQ